MKKMILAVTLCAASLAHASDDWKARSAKLEVATLLNTKEACTQAHANATKGRLNADDSWTLGFCESMLSMAKMVILSGSEFAYSESPGRREWIKCMTMEVFHLRHDVPRVVGPLDEMQMISFQDRINDIIVSMEVRARLACGDAPK